MAVSEMPRESVWIVWRKSEVMGGERVPYEVQRRKRWGKPIS